jgi:hypothetical protein
MLTHLVVLGYDIALNVNVNPSPTSSWAETTDEKKGLSI